MFKMISWPQFLGALVVLTVLYYACVAVLYYRAELMGLLSGKGKLVGDVETPAPAASSVLGKSTLIPKAAVAAAQAPAPVTALVKSEPDAAGEVQNQVEITTAGETEIVPEEATIEASNEKSENENAIIIVSDNEKSIKFTNESTSEATRPTNTGAEVKPEELEEDFTVGVEQLSDYFARAAAGDITQEELVEEVPALENTDLLVAFYKNSKQTAQSLTASLYAGIADPTTD